MFSKYQRLSSTLNIFKHTLYKAGFKYERFNLNAKKKAFALSQQIYLERNLFHSQYFSVEFNSFWDAIYS